MITKSALLFPFRITIKKIKEKSIRTILFLAAISAIVVIFSIIFFLFREGFPIFEKAGLWNFLSGTRWFPDGNPPLFGTFSLIVDTLLVTLGAMIIAIPLSIGSAIFISEIAPPKLRNVLKPAVELLAGIPSVVYGFLGLIVLVPWIANFFGVPTGLSWLAGSIILGIMAIPTITSVAEDAINSVPKEFKEGSLAMGATKWQTISKVIVPCSISGITAAIILGIGRAIGETMAVVMVCGNPPYGLIPSPITNVFSAVKTLTATLANEMPEVSTGSSHYQALFGIALILLVITLVVNVIATMILGRLKEKQTATAKIKNRRSYMVIQQLKRYLVPLLGFIVVIVLLLLAGILITAIIAIAVIGFYYISKNLSAKNVQRFAFGMISIAIIIVIIILGILLSNIVSNGIGALNWNFLTQAPADNGRAGGIFPAIIGTLYLVAGAIFIALPLGVGAAIYLTEYTREGKLTKFIRAGADLLNGTPSIVFGLFGFAFLVLYLKMGFTLIAGQITLAFMILPTIIRTTEEALKSIPQSLREGSLAVGASKWQTIRKVVLPPAAPGILTGAILGIGRAAGETAPIMFTAVVFSGPYVPQSLFEPVMALPYHLYYLATQVPNSAAMRAGTALVLLLLVIGFYLIAILIRNHYRKTMKW